MYQRVENNNKIGELIARLKIIVGFIELEDLQDIHRQLKVVRELNLGYICSPIIETLALGEYDRALGQIKCLLTRYSQLLVYVDAEVAALHLKMKQLYEQLATIEQNSENLHAIFHIYQIERYRRLNQLENDIIVTKREFYRRKMEHIKAKTTEFKESLQNQQCRATYEQVRHEYEQATHEYEQAEHEYEQVMHDYEEVKKQTKQDMKYYQEAQEKEKERIKDDNSNDTVVDDAADEATKELTRLYREAVLQCHPDRLSDEMQKQLAHRTCTRLNTAYAQHDLETVKLIHEQLKLGLIAVNIPVHNMKKLLRMERDTLRQQVEAKSNAYKVLCSSNQDFLTIMPTRNDVVPYLEKQEAQLRHELADWQRRINEFITKNFVTNGTDMVLAVANNLSTGQQCIKRDWDNLIQCPFKNVTIGPANNNDLFEWRGIFIGPKETPYDGGRFLVSIHFPDNYPQKEPILRLTTKIYHPNVTGAGNIVFNHNQHWSPTDTIITYLLSIYSFIFYPKVENERNSLDVDIARQFQTDRVKFIETAKKWTQDFAMT